MQPTITFPDDRALLALIKGRVEEGGATGVVLGVLDADGSQRIVSYGDAGPGARPLGPESVFEIGSITKAFTGIVLADMAARGEVEVTAPVQRYAPHGLTMPRGASRQITLLDLASHRSGLPRLPGNLTLDDPANPYARYSVAQMYDFLASYELPREIGSEYEYSNLGAGLLGHVLAAHAGVDYERLMRNRILDPLGMTMTGVALSPAMKAQLAVGHDVQGRAAALWDFAALAGAGALRSNMCDMLRFLQANVGEPRSDLERAMRMSHPPRARNGMGVGLAWHSLSLGSTTVVFHNGGTGGYRSVIGFEPLCGVGVVVLTNSAKDADDLALGLINRATGVAPPPIARTPIDLPAESLARYVGEYEYLRGFTRTVSIKVTLEDGVLIVDSAGLSKVPIAAESGAKFFARTQDVQFTFVGDAAGVVSGLVLHYPRFSRSATKVR